MSALLRARRRKLLVILGAGSSVSCGIPGSGAIGAEMKVWSTEWKKPPEFPNGVGRGAFNDLWEVIEQYYSRDPHPHLGIPLNFESVLAEMTALASWVSPSPFGNALSGALRDSAVSTQFTWPPAPPGSPYFFRHLILEQTGDLLAQLARYIRHHSRMLHENNTNFQTYRKLLGVLATEFDLGIYSLNYDNLAIRALPDFFTGFREGKFDARQVALRREWDFVYHLHGSVHYSLSHGSDRGMAWQTDLTTDFIDTGRAFPYMASNFNPILRTTLIAGGFKLDQILADPAQSFYAALIRHVHEADSILIAGYGFSDHHVNRALQNRCDFAPSSFSGRPPVVVLTKTDAAIGRTGARRDFWAWELTHALNTKFNISVPAQSFRQLIEDNHFEIDSHNRVAIWHAGFIELFSTRIGAVICRLSQP